MLLGATWVYEGGCMAVRACDLLPDGGSQGGLLGIAATALFWLYILGRLMTGAVTLNASVREQRIATALPADD